MSHSKKLLALLLSLVLALGLAVPAFAAGEADEAMPVITKQPEDVVVAAKFFYVPAEYTLSVEAYCPNGDPVGYQWCDAVPITGAVDSAYTSRFGSSSARKYTYYCIVYNAKEGFDSEYRVTSNVVYVSQREDALSLGVTLLALLLIGLPASVLLPLVPIPPFLTAGFVGVALISVISELLDSIFGW